MAGGTPVFWLAVLAVALPAAIGVTQRSVNHILRPPGVDAGAGPPSVRAVCLERGLRAALIIGAALLLAHAWQIDLVALTASDTTLTRLARGILSAIVILLLADLAWHVLRTVIDHKLADAQIQGQPNSDEARRRARARTLLPILRNVLFVILMAMAAMMALSALGVEIGPLIAGAGVVGVAIGFGAQTLVKDVISGMFYLLDDAFRVGEYIQSGNYKGTVESFSLRSVKLRHQRGPLYTVPFGTLGAIQNMSRDWVIEKLKVGVTYDTDLDKVRTLIKQIGKELAQDPEFAPHIIEPLKMQGVEAVRRLCDPDQHEDDDPPRRAVRDPAAGLRDDQEGLRRQRHQDRLPDRAGRRARRRERPPRWRARGWSCSSRPRRRPREGRAAAPAGMDRSPTIWYRSARGRGTRGDARAASERRGARDPIRRHG